jgi:hypothetical protein
MPIVISDDVLYRVPSSLLMLIELHEPPPMAIQTTRTESSRSWLPMAGVVRLRRSSTPTARLLAMVPLVSSLLPVSSMYPRRRKRLPSRKFYRTNASR